MALAESPSAELNFKQPDISWLTAKWFALLLGLLVFATFLQVAIGSQSFFFRDFGLFGYPLAHYYRESFWRGELPQWNPYNNFGIPFLAQWGTMVLYPPSLIYLLLPLPWSLGIFCLLHLWFGGCGMYLLSWKWTGHRLAAVVAGIAFSFNGFTLNCLMWPNYTASLAWMPWVVLATSRGWREGGRSLLTASLVGAMQMLSGTPEVILFTWLIVVALWCCDHARKGAPICPGALRLTAIIFATAALSSAQLLPFFELLRHSDRHTDFASNSGWSVPPWGWANLLVPVFRTVTAGAGVHFQPQQQLTSSYYVGSSALLFAIGAALFTRGLRVWMLSGAAVASFILAMGEHGLVYPWLRKALPALGFMRYPAKFLIVGTFVWPLLAGFGIAAFAHQRSSRRWLNGLAVTATLLIVVIVACARVGPAPDGQWSATLRNGVERALFLLGIFAALTFALRNVVPQRALLLLVPLLCWIDLIRHVPPQNPTINPANLTVTLPALQAMDPRPELGKSRAALSIKALDEFHFPGTSNLGLTCLVLRSGLHDNCNLPERVPKADGFFALYLQHERDINSRLFETRTRLRPALARFLGISQISGQTNLLAWQPRSDFLPIITCGQKPLFADSATTLAGITASNFSPETMVFLPEGARASAASTDLGSARVLSFDVREHRIAAEIEAAQPSIVVVAQTFYPAWHAFVDGTPVRIWRANHAFQALYTSPGRHRIELVYRDRHFLGGLYISGGSLLVIGAAWIIGVRARKRTGCASLQDTSADLPSVASGPEACV
jgi:hypothetical protein